MVIKDLNKMLSNIKDGNIEIEIKLKTLLGKYENLYHEANRQLYQERAASNSMDGLEDFHFMVQIIKRNRDVISSLVRGVSNLRSLKDFSIIEEDIPEKKSSNKISKKKLNVPNKVPVIIPEPVELGSEEAIDG